MSAGDTTQEWHLTPHGWVEGTVKYYDVVQTYAEPPADRVETWERHMEQSSSYSHETITRKPKWVSPSYSDPEHEAVKAKFPKPF